jgi:hypothetical protein
MDRHLDRHDRVMRLLLRCDLGMLRDTARHARLRSVTDITQTLLLLFLWAVRRQVPLLLRLLRIGWLWIRSDLQSREPTAYSYAQELRQ